MTGFVSITVSSAPSSALRAIGSRVVRDRRALLLDEATPELAEAGILVAGGLDRPADEGGDDEHADRDESRPEEDPLAHETNA